MTKIATDHLDADEKPNDTTGDWEHDNKYLAWPMLIWKKFRNKTGIAHMKTGSTPSHVANRRIQMSNGRVEIICLLGALFTGCSRIVLSLLQGCPAIV